MPDLTSIKVPREVRDRFAAAARSRGVTVRELLNELSRQAADDALMQQVAQQMEHTKQTDPDGWSEYVGEGGAWEDRSNESLDA